MARKRVGTGGRGAARRTTRRPARRPAPRKAPLGVLIWTTLILLILVVFLFNRTTINTVVDRTELLTVLQRSIDNAAGGAPQEPQEPPATAPPPPQERPQPPAAPPAPAPPPATTSPQVVAVPAAPPAAPPPSEPAIRERRLFFAAVSDAGEIAVTGVTRAIDDSASPLTATLQTLFAGPVQSELNQGLITLIPPAATLNRVHVSDRIAYVDVSESFRFNPLGREGIDAQLRQLVLSATEFPRVEMVQILIDGRRVDFLGPEGAYIGEPISRAALGSGPRP